jgi:non-ribosomal peptide synthase protein (TIGR01720 family)
MHDSQTSDLPVATPSIAKKAVDTLSFVLSEELTTALLFDVPQAYRTQIGDALLTALVDALSHSAEKTSFAIDFETHGRAAIADDIDLLRTIGRFATTFPLLLHVADNTNPGKLLQSVKEQLRKVPGGGLGYGLLRESNGDHAPDPLLQSMRQPQVSLRHRGQLDQMLPTGSRFKLLPDTSEAEIQLRHPVELTTSIRNNQLHMQWAYRTNHVQHATVEQLAQRFISALEAIIAHCQSPISGGYTPSDFPESGLGQDELNALLAEIGALGE